MPETTPHEKILSIVQGFWRARAVAVATELDLPELLADGPMHVEELARRTETNSAALFRLLRALESVGIFTQSAPRTFSNTAMSASLRKSAAGSQWPMVLHCLGKGNGPVEGWNDLDYAIRTGEPSINKSYGYSFWELLRLNPTAREIMNATMRSASLVMTPAVTAAYKWGKFPVIADIGGGIGTQLVSILDATPAAKGILFDLPQLKAESIFHPRMEVISGNFFEQVPTGVDAYLMRFVVHDWDDTKAAEILRCVRRHMKPTARLILIEHVISEGAAFDYGKWTDLQMLIAVGGRERTKDEFLDLLSREGFDLEEVIFTTSPLRLLVAKPASSYDKGMTRWVFPTREPAKPSAQQTRYWKAPRSGRRRCADDPQIPPAYARVAIDLALPLIPAGAEP